MKAKLKFLGLALFYVGITYCIIWVLQSRHWLTYQYHCAWFPGRPPVVEPAPFEWNGSGLVTLWFDDDWLSQYANASPLMKRYGYPGVLTVVTDTVCSPYHMSWHQVYELVGEGWEIVSGGRSKVCDAYLLEQSPALLDSEIVGSQKDLSLHHIITSLFVSPCGFPTYLFPNLENKILKNYSTIRIADSSLNHLPLTNTVNLTSYFIDESIPLSTIEQLLNEAKEQRSWLILTFRQVDGYPYYFNTSLPRFQAILELIKKSQLPVVLPSQVLIEKRIIS